MRFWFSFVDYTVSCDQCGANLGKADSWPPQVKALALAMQHGREAHQVQLDLCDTATMFLGGTYDSTAGFTLEPVEEFRDITTRDDLNPAILFARYLFGNSSVTSVANGDGTYTHTVRQLLTRRLPGRPLFNLDFVAEAAADFDLPRPLYLHRFKVPSVPSSFSDLSDAVIAEGSEAVRRFVEGSRRRERGPWVTIPWASVSGSISMKFEDTGFYDRMKEAVQVETDRALHGVQASCVKCGEPAAQDSVLCWTCIGKMKSREAARHDGKDRQAARPRSAVDEKLAKRNARRDARRHRNRGRR